MGYRLERVEGASRQAYILYTEEMQYLATMSWFRGHLVYEMHCPSLVNISARQFEDHARTLDKGDVQ